MGVNVNVYEKDLDNKWIKIDFGKLHKEMRRKNIVRKIKTVYVGRQKFKTTIVIEILPEREYEARSRKNKKGQNLSDKQKAQNGLNIYITNTDFKADEIGCYIQ